MHKKFPGKIVANFGGKYYQAASTAASSSDIWVTYGSKEDVAPELGSSVDRQVPRPVRRQRAQLHH